VDELEFSGYEILDIERGYRFAKNGPVGRLAAPGSRIHGQIEVLAPKQICVADPGAGVRSDHAVRYFELVNWGVKALGSHVQQGLAGSGTSLGKTFVIKIRRRGLAARSGSLVGRNGGVTLNQMHAVESDAEFLGHQLGLDRVHALAKVAFSGVGRNEAIGSDGDPGIQLIRIQVRHVSIEWTLCSGERLEQRSRAEAHDKRTRIPKKIAAGNA
jgi:hypothetical protein